MKVYTFSYLIKILNVTIIMLNKFSMNSFRRPLTEVHQQMGLGVYHQYISTYSMWKEKRREMRARIWKQ